MDDPESLLDAAGIDLLPTKPHIETIPATCEICYNDEPGMKTYAMRCGHRFCTDCYRHYLGQKIWEEGEAAHIQCPQDNCNRIVDSKTLELLVSDDMKDRYVRSRVVTVISVVASGANETIDIIPF